MIPLLDQNAIAAAKVQTKKAETIAEQRLNVRYHIENPEKENRPQKFLEAFAAILENSNYGFVLDHYLRVRAKCSRCASECFLYQATGDPDDVPCARSSLLLDTYQRYFTMGGRLKSLFCENDLTDEKIEKMAESVWNCTACRRCMLECPVGIDHGLLTHLARCILGEIGIAPRALVISTRAQLDGEHRNTSNIPVPALKDTIEFLEEEIQEEKEVQVRFPLDEEGAEYVFFSPVSDYLMEADTLMGIAAVLHAAGASWTIGTDFADAINYGLFYSDRLMDRIIKEVDAQTRKLKGKKVLIGECGHASRTAKMFLPAFCGGEEAFPVVNIMEFTYDAWKQGKIKLIPNTITERVTYHDPCNLARTGWITEGPRELIRAFCSDFVEMTPNREENYCCGGGGGTVSIDELRPYRTGISGLAKAEQIKATGAKYVIAPCANCKKQLREVLEDNRVDCEVVGLHDLIYKALVLEKPASAPSEETTEVSEEEHAGM
jgi:Fe-S oxidoreductase